MANSCLTVTEEKIRAIVSLGGVEFRTPYVKSFNVNKSRGQISNTFNVTLEVLAGTSFSLGQPVVIRAGLRGSEKKIFTGVVEGTSVRPVYGKPSYFSLTVQGSGVLSVLENKTFSRRLSSTGQGLFCLITGGNEQHAEKFYSLSKRVDSGNHTVVSSSPSPTGGEGDQSPLIIHESSTASKADGGIAGQIAGKPASGGSEGTSGDGFRSHTHEDMTEGGPSFGVYSAD